MWLCSSCGLAQLVADPTIAEEPLGSEPAALVAQAVDAVQRVSERGWLSRASMVAEYGSPHGGSWLELLNARGLATARAGETADVVLDCFGLMHAPDQFAALGERTARVAPDGLLLLQYHALSTIVDSAQWNVLRHGHYAYYSTTALAQMLAAQGFTPRMAWQFELYGGTVLLAACRDADRPIEPAASVRQLLARDGELGVRDAAVLSCLQHEAVGQAERLYEWLVEERAAGRRVLGYGAASRAIALLLRAGVEREILPAVVDSSPAKRGRRMPGTDIPIVDPSELAVLRPDTVLLFLPDLLNEVRTAFPEVEATGGMWVDATTLASAPHA
jgi:hypothetical protein